MLARLKSDLQGLPPAERKVEFARIAALVRDLGGADLLEPQTSSSRRSLLVAGAILFALVPLSHVAGFARWQSDPRDDLQPTAYVPCTRSHTAPPSLGEGFSPGSFANGIASSLPSSDFVPSSSGSSGGGGGSNLPDSSSRNRRRGIRGSVSVGDVATIDGNGVASGKRHMMGSALGGNAEVYRSSDNADPVGDTYIRPGAAVGSRSSYPSHGAFQHPREALRKTMAPGRNTSDFPLLVCIGQGKTATKSLNKAMVMLGFRTAHFYGAGIYGLLYDNAAEAARQNFLFNVNEEKHVDAVLDTPVVEFYNEILLAYPNARVVLTIREPRSWLKSQQKFYCCYARGCRNWLAPWRRGSNLVYGTECPSKAQALKRYVQHNRNVYDNVPHDRLLIMDIPGGDGWEKLVPFLNSFLPQRVPMPPSNFTFPSRH